MAQVKTKANLKENVHDLNPIEPTKPKSDDSSNKSKLKVDSVDEKEEICYEEEPNILESIKKLEASEPTEELNADEPVEPSVDLKLTIPMPTSSNTTKKSEFLIMMDMMKFMHNQQQAYWKYPKIRYDSVESEIGRKRTRTPSVGDGIGEIDEFESKLTQPKPQDRAILPSSLAPIPFP
ncbi:hypothetical protein J1N35_025415 [Gossypium stocksii]|uniref:Uncharacterized protein n=1 Tax=Gossypium stocksii TaxID=47602 RepID=A0A9D3V6J7_9ROSI|nr:hypothetical protein J1N35_025415 [Gossypium stocksii]